MSHTGHENHIPALCPDRWEPIRTIWPYRDGWGVYNARRGQVLETGLPTKEAAQAACDEENAR